MYCSRCGAAAAENAPFCSNCGQSLSDGPSQPVGMAPIPAPVFSAPGVRAGAPPMTAPISSVPAYPPVAASLSQPYAGFWLRLVAYIIDSVILMLGLCVLVGLIAAVLGAGFFRNLSNMGEEVNSAPNVFGPIFVLMILTFIFLAIAANWLYYAWFESSEHQATLGKMALGLIVTDMEGRRITFARASGRFFAKIVTGLIPFFIGYIMAGFTAKKQALHDMIASCLVLRRV
jgi:uncharacterized RDD family membrane protein YckC